MDALILNARGCRLVDVPNPPPPEWRIVVHRPTNWKVPTEITLQTKVTYPVEVYERVRSEGYPVVYIWRGTDALG